MYLTGGDLTPIDCDTCGLAKRQHQNHQKSAVTNVTDPLELVYTDLSGPIKPKSGGGNKRFVEKLTDDFTRLKSVYFIEKKSDALDALVSYHKDVVVPSGSRL